MFFKKFALLAQDLQAQSESTRSISGWIGLDFAEKSSKSKLI